MTTRTGSASLHIRRSSQALLAPALLMLAACGGDGGSSQAPGPAPAPAPQASVERQIKPSDANPAATQVPFYNIAINPDPAVAAKGRLFVFLPGTGGTPAGSERILRVGAARGYHTIDLAYPDTLAAGQACKDDPNAECTALFREEILLGRPLSPHIDVDVPNSVVQRLTDLLAYLARTYPEEGWDQFLSNGAVNWSLVSVGGHSQGAGHAAYLAKLFAVYRTAMFSGVADLGPDGKTAAWVGRTGKTAASSQYGFGHRRDPVVPLFVQRDSWLALGMDAFGPIVSVDGASPPFGGSHELATNAEPGSQAPANPPDSIFHSVPITDGATPLAADGSALFAPVWAYMAFP